MPVFGAGLLKPAALSEKFLKNYGFLQNSSLQPGKNGLQ
jgi:hypothetical protein